MDLAVEFQKLQQGQEKILQMFTGMQIPLLKTDQVFTKKDLAKKFNVTERTVDNWKTRGQLDFIQIGSKTYFTSSQIEDFLQHNEVKSHKMRRS